MLPTVTIAGQKFFDISEIVTPDRAPRVRTIGLAEHHSVGANFDGAAVTMQQEIDHIIAINAQHVAAGYGGFGYNGAAFASGRVYSVGQGNGQRAHVERRNHELGGLVFMGTYTTRRPGLGCILGGARWFAAMRQQSPAIPGGIPILGHREWAIAASPTACPGDGGIAVLPQVRQAAAAIQMQADDVIREQVRDTIRRALAKAFQEADLRTLAQQIAYISEGTLCNG